MPIGALHRVHDAGKWRRVGGKEREKNKERIMSSLLVRFTIRSAPDLTCCFWCLFRIAIDGGGGRLQSGAVNLCPQLLRQSSVRSLEDLLQRNVQVSPDPSYYCAMYARICTYLRERINRCLRRAGPTIAGIDGSGCAIRLCSSLVVEGGRRRGRSAIISQHRSKFSCANWPCMSLSTRIPTSCPRLSRPTYPRLLWRICPYPGAL